MNPEELGTRHANILNVVFNRSKSSVVIAAGEMRVLKTETDDIDHIDFNFSSGTVMIDTFDFSIPLVSGLNNPHFKGGISGNPLYREFWIPSVTYILRTIFSSEQEQVNYTDETFASPEMSNDYVSELCNNELMKNNMYVYSDIKDCNRDRNRAFYNQLFCNPE